MNEYLTGVAESDAAFKQLIDYFDTVDRPVIVCMLGDHYPSFIREVADEGKYSEEELELRLRSTPLVIWANYNLPDGDIGYISTNFVASYLLHLAGAATSPYFTYELALMEDYPVVSAYGSYRDANGNLFTYDESPNQAIKEYFYVEYANIMQEADENWFGLGS